LRYNCIISFELLQNTPTYFKRTTNKATNFLQANFGDHLPKPKAQAKKYKLPGTEKPCIEPPKPNQRRNQVVLNAVKMLP